MIEKIIGNFRQLDINIEAAIIKFLEGKYFPPGKLPFFTAVLPKNIKLIFYFFTLSSVVLIFKILYPENKRITLVLVSFLIIEGALLVFVFLGFMQLLYP